MAITLELIQKLRAMTGAGVADCKEALEQSGGDIDKAIEFLQKKGAKTLGKRADNATAEGIIHAYIHANKRVGAIIELRCETDFVAKNSDFENLANELALQIVACAPLYVKRADVPEEVTDKQKLLFTEMLKEEGKPEAMIGKIMEGKLNKWYAEVCLLEQPYIKDEEVTIADFINQKIAAIGEKVEVAGFSRRQI